MSTPENLHECERLEDEPLTQGEIIEILEEHDIGYEFLWNNGEPAPQIILDSGSAMLYADNGKELSCLHDGYRGELTESELLAWIEEGA